jgi:P27 family predicted phage terminase small subunit
MLRGNPTGKALPKNEPQPSIEIPPPPSFLSNIGKREYRRVAKILKPLGVITELDSTMLAAYADAFSTWADAVDKIKSEGYMLTGKNGNFYQNPYVGMKNQAMEKVIKIAAEFGMTPSSRSRVSAAKPPEKNAGNAYEQWKADANKKT